MFALRLAAGALFLIPAALASTAIGQNSSPIALRIDLTDAPRHLVHVAETLPAHAGENSFSYPEWIPGRHRPSGPIDNLTGIVFHAEAANGPVIPWRRDLIDLYSFHVQAPPATRSITVTFDVLDEPSRRNGFPTKLTSSHMVMLEPSFAVLYPTGKAVREVPVAAAIHLPAGWSSATALQTAGQMAPALHGQDTTYATVSMEQLVDSPILSGDHCRQYPLAAELKPAHTLDVCTDKAADLDLQPAFLAGMNNLVRQERLVFKSHHYDHYDFLVAASPYIHGETTEHTQSADFSVSSLDMKDQQRFIGSAFSHEFTHSWCGKYRRPAGMATPDYHTPQQDDLLWVYEGLTQYYGYVLGTRAGLQTPQQTIETFRDDIDNFLDAPGRTWRPLQDTADSLPVLRDADPTYSTWRRGVDYYQEGAVLWLEADMTIRRLSGGKRSLDDFSARFFSATPAGKAGDTGPSVFPYHFEDVVRALNETQPYDWATFWTTRLNALTTKPPTKGFEAAGYSYTLTEEIGPSEASFLKASHSADTWHSLGFFVIGDGTLQEVAIGSPAFTAGLGPGDKLTAVNGQPYTGELLMKLVHDSKQNMGPITLTATREDESATYTIDYHGGEKYAVLKRNGNPDVLTTEILKPVP